jgi:hypothetical protein
MLALVIAAAALIWPQPAARPGIERLQPLDAAVEAAQRHAIALAERARDQPVPQPAVDEDEAQTVYVALVDADLALRSLQHQWPPILSARDIDRVALQLALAREALSDYTTARTDGRRVDMREAAEGLRVALGRAGTVLADAAERLPGSDTADRIGP